MVQSILRIYPPLFSALSMMRSSENLAIDRMSNDTNSKLDQTNWIFENFQAIGKSQKRFLFLLLLFSAYSLLVFLSKPTESLTIGFLSINVQRNLILKIMPSVILITVMALTGALTAAGLSRKRLTDALHGHFETIGERLPIAWIDQHPNLLDYLETLFTEQSPELPTKPTKFNFSSFFYPICIVFPMLWAGGLAGNVALETLDKSFGWRILDIWHVILIITAFVRTAPYIKRQWLRAFPEKR